MTMQMDLHPQYIIDDNGNKTSVVLPIDEFESIQTILENAQLNEADVEFKNLQISSMSKTWDNKQDEAWDEL
jgi:hypothetical protein